MNNALEQRMNVVASPKKVLGILVFQCRVLQNNQLKVASELHFIHLLLTIKRYTYFE